MEALSAELLKRLPGWKLSDNQKKDEAIKEQVKYELVDIALFAKYGLADAAFSRGDHGAVVALLDPLVDEINKPGEPQEKVNLQKSPQLATVMLSLGLRSNLLLGKTERTEQVLEALDKVSGGEMGAGDGNNMLKLLAALIRQQVEEVRKKGDKDALAKAVKGFTALLDKRIQKQGDKLTSEFILVLSDCYSNMEQHDKAADVLGKVPDKKAAPGSPEEKAYRGVQLVYARELRLANTEESLKKASELMTKVMGEAAPPAKKGWGRSDLLAMKEYGLLLEAKGEYKEAFLHWLPIVKQLAKTVQSDNRKKPHYFECFYHMTYCFYKERQASQDAKKRADGITDTAKQIRQFEKAWDGFGDDASTKRFTEFLAKEPDLQKAYDDLKKAGK
jgi:tetratricopeptide (TPR) repeat protein